jgi:DNA primase
VKDKWIRQGLIGQNPIHLPYLISRGVGEGCKVNFNSWQPHGEVLCPKFKSNFGISGERIKDSLIIPISSPRGEIIGVEARSINEDGSKRVHQYRTLSSQWNPFILGSEDTFRALWNLGDLWIVEGIFDKVSLDRVVSPYDAVTCTLRAGMDANTLDMIERYYSPASTIFICYDNDETGKKKSYWLHKEMTKRGMRAVIWKYRGKDPNDVWTQGGDHALRRMFL